MCVQETNTTRKERRKEGRDGGREEGREGREEGSISMGDSSEEEKEYKRNVSYDFKDPHTRHAKKKGPVQIRFKTNFRNTLYDVCKSRPGWK